MATLTISADMFLDGQEGHEHIVVICNDVLDMHEFVGNLAIARYWLYT